MEFHLDHPVLPFGKDRDFYLQSLTDRRTQDSTDAPWNDGTPLETIWGTLTRGDEHRHVRVELRNGAAECIEVLDLDQRDHPHDTLDGVPLSDDPRAVVAALTESGRQPADRVDEGSIHFWAERCTLGVETDLEDIPGADESEPPVWISRARTLCWWDPQQWSTEAFTEYLSS